jgi:hypothetical protein
MVSPHDGHTRVGVLAPTRGEGSMLGAGNPAYASPLTQAGLC